MPPLLILWFDCWSITLMLLVLVWLLVLVLVIELGLFDRSMVIDKGGATLCKGSGVAPDPLRVSM